MRICALLLLSALLAGCHRYARNPQWRPPLQVTHAPFESGPRTTAQGYADRAYVMPISARASACNAGVPVVEAPTAAGPSTHSSADAALDERGGISVSSTPGGDVFIDDQPVGMTPVDDFLVVPGRHRVRVVNRETEMDASRLVDVRPYEIVDVVLELHPMASR